MKIASIIGARPQFVKAALISQKIKENNFLDELLIHTGQHYDQNMSGIFFNQLKIAPPSYNLGINQLNRGEMVDQMVVEINKILTKKRIDGILVYGDTNSTLAASIAAKKLDLPLFHVEAGLRSFNRLMIEENNRIITDHLSSLLFCPTENSITNLKNENLHNGVIFSGDVMYDIFLKYFPEIEHFKKNIFNSDYLLSTIHRRENIESQKDLSIIFDQLNEINDKQKIIMPIHPHTKRKLEEYNIKSKIVFIQPQGFLSMLSLLKNCDAVITDSGGLQKEAFFAKKKCITVRNETEWTELIEENVNILCDSTKILDCYNNFKAKSESFSKKLFGDGKASELIVNSIFNFLK